MLLNCNYIILHEKITRNDFFLISWWHDMSTSSRQTERRKEGRMIQTCITFLLSLFSKKFLPCSLVIEGSFNISNRSRIYIRWTKNESFFFSSTGIKCTVRWMNSSRWGKTSNSVGRWRRECFRQEGISSLWTLDSAIKQIRFSHSKHTHINLYILYF